VRRLRRSSIAPETCSAATTLIHEELCPLVSDTSPPRSRLTLVWVAWVPEQQCTSYATIIPLRAVPRTPCSSSSEASTQCSLPEDTAKRRITIMWTSSAASKDPPQQLQDTDESTTSTNTSPRRMFHRITLLMVSVCVPTLLSSPLLTAMRCASLLL
jgi:hypothetical protein